MRQQQTKPDLLSKPAYNSVPNSPQSAKSGLTIVGRIDPRRILSPGRVSPIDSDPIVGSIQKMSHEPIPVVDSMPKSRSESFRAPTIGIPGPGQYSGPDSGSAGGEEREEVYDARLNMKGKNGAVLVLELNSEVLAANSEVFAELISEHKRGSSSGSNRMCRIEVPEVDNLGVFRETIELMFEDDENITKKLLKMGVYRAIDVLEVSMLLLLFNLSFLLVSQFSQKICCFFILFDSLSVLSFLYSFFLFVDFFFICFIVCIRFVKYRKWSCLSLYR